MNRRDAIKAAGLFAGSLLTSSVLAQPQWIKNKHVSEFGASVPVVRKADRKSFHSEFSPFKGVSRSIGKNVLLYQNLQKQIGEIVPHDQRTIVEVDGTVSRRGEGDCVGQAAAMGCDVLAATNIHMLGIQEKWEAKASVEMLYAGSRIEIGRDNFAENPKKENWLKGRAGSHGEWVSQFVKDYGVLHRKEYTKGRNSLDLRGYSPDRSREYRDVGVPDWLEPIAREHPVREVTNVQSGREALDAVCAGQPVILCSSYAFQNTRDADGFCLPHMGVGGRLFGGVVRKQWWHAMILTGAILEGGRVGGVIQNSHAAWNSGPQPLDIPDGAFGVDLSILDLMVKDWFDCYALSSYKGHSAKKIRHRLY